MAEAILADVDSSGIYQIRNLVNGKRYIGSAKRFRSRWNSHRSHLRNGKHSSKHLQNSWNRRGEESFVFEAIEVCSLENLIEREQWWLDNHKPEYNVSPTAGSPLGVRHSQEFCRKVSARFKGKTLSDAQKIRMGESSKSSWMEPKARANRIAAIRGSYNEGLLEKRRIELVARWKRPGYREDQVKKITESHTAARRALTSSQGKARWADPEYRQKMSEAFRGRVVSPESREKIKASLTGRPLSVETKRKKSALTDDQVRQARAMRDSGCTQAYIAETFKVCIGTIARLCQGTRYGWVK